MFVITQHVYVRLLFSDNSGEKWVKGFVAREKLEKVKNCTQLNKSLRDRIIQTVLNKVLDSQEQSSTLTLSSGKIWNKGGLYSLY